MDFILEPQKQFGSIGARWQLFSRRVYSSIVWTGICRFELTHAPVTDGRILTPSVSSSHTGNQPRCTCCSKWLTTWPDVLMGGERHDLFMTCHNLPQKSNFDCLPGLSIVLLSRLDLNKACCTGRVPPGEEVEFIFKEFFLLELEPKSWFRIIRFAYFLPIIVWFGKLSLLCSFLMMIFQS